MKLRILGCSGGIGGEHLRTTSLLVDDDVLIDAGTGVGDLPIADLARIDHVFLTHTHLDHIACLPLMVDTIASGRAGRPLRVHALPHTLAALRQHVFNDLIWPDFTRLPCPDAPLLTFHPIDIGATRQVHGRDIEVLPAIHTCLLYTSPSPRD